MAGKSFVCMSWVGVGVDVGVGLSVGVAVGVLVGTGVVVRVVVVTVVQLVVPGCVSGTRDVVWVIEDGGSVAVPFDVDSLDSDDSELVVWVPVPVVDVELPEELVVIEPVVFSPD